MSKRKAIYSAIVQKGDTWASEVFTFTNLLQDHVEITIQTLTTTEQALVEKVEALEAELGRLKTGEKGE